MKKICLMSLIASNLFIVMLADQHVSAEEDCQHCMEFLMLTHDYKKSVLDAARGNSDTIPELVNQYPKDVLRLYNSSAGQ